MPHVIYPPIYPVPVQLTDSHDHKGRVDFVGKQWITDPIRTHGSTFVGTTIDTNFWTSASANGGSNTQANSLLTLASGTSANGRATVKSVRLGRFIFFNPIASRAAVRIPTVSVTDNTRRWGAFTDSAGVPQDGYYYELSSAGVLSVKAVNATSNTLNVASGSFNGELGTTYTVDTNAHAYEIIYFVMEVNFIVDGRLLHKARPTTTNFTGVYSLPSNFVSINGATGGVDGTMEVWAANAMRLGPQRTLPRSFFQSGTVAAQVLKRGPGEVHRLQVNNVSNTSVITLYDNTAASGTILWTSGSMPNQTQPFDVALEGTQFETGLTLTIATANCNVLVVYE